MGTRLGKGIISNSMFDMIITNFLKNWGSNKRKTVFFVSILIYYQTKFTVLSLYIKGLPFYWQI